MRLSPHVARLVLAVVLAVSAAIPAGATTLTRLGLEGLTATNEMILFGRVLDIHSYWNPDHNFIMTDVRVRPTLVLKGDRSAQEVTFTVLGGTVGDITTLIIAGPELTPGSDYVLFLNREALHGNRNALTVRDLSQGAFDVANVGGDRRAFSQALSHALVPDAAGLADPPGGSSGLALDDMFQQIRQLAGDR